MYRGWLRAIPLSARETLVRSELQGSLLRFKQVTLRTPTHRDVPPKAQKSVKSICWVKIAVAKVMILVARSLNSIYIYIIYLETRATSKFWCWSSKTVFHLIAAEISGMRRSLGNKYGFRFWCWNAPFLPMIAPFLPVIAPSLPVQNFHCAVFAELRHVFYIAPFLWTCAWFFCRLGMRPKFWIHESLGIYIYTHA